MGKVIVRPVDPAEFEAVQKVFNHKDIIGWLGGFTMLDQLVSASKGGKLGLFGAFAGDEPIGAMMVGGRPQGFIMKYGSVGVVPERRRMRVASALYLALTLQGVLEGRRIFEDTIVGDNPYQFLALPKLGIQLVGRLRQHTGSAKDICLFDFSLMSDDLEAMADRVLGKGIEIQVVENYYTDEVFETNISTYQKKLPHYAADAIAYKEKFIKHLPFVKVVRDPTPHPTKVRQAAQEARRKAGFFTKETPEQTEE